MANVGTQTTFFDSGDADARTPNVVDVFVPSRATYDPAQPYASDDTVSIFTTGINPVVIPRPPSAKPGKLLIAVILGLGNTPTLTPPTGWTLLDGPTNWAGATTWGWTYYRIVDGTDPNSYSFSLSTGSIYHAFMRVFAVDDVKNPINASAFAANATVVPPQVTTTRPNTQLFGFFAIQAGDWATRTFLPPAGESDLGLKRDATTNWVVEGSGATIAGAGTTSRGNYQTATGWFNNAYKMTIAVVPATVPAVLNLTPSSFEGNPSTVDSGTSRVGLLPGFAFGSELATFADSNVARVSLTPSVTEFQVPILDSGSVYFDLQPSGQEFTGQQYTDSNTVRATLTPSVSDIYGPFVFTDSGTALLTFTPSRFTGVVQRVADDDFNRATLGPNWATLPLYAGSPDITSNAYFHSATYSSAYWTPNKFGPDVFTSLRVVNTGFPVFLFARVDDTYMNGYALYVQPSGGIYYFYRLTGNALNQLTYQYAAYPQVGNRIGFQVKGSVLTAYLDTGSGFQPLQYTVSDSTYTAEGWAGVGIGSSGGGSLDDFHAEDVITLPQTYTDAPTIPLTLTPGYAFEGREWVDVVTTRMGLTPIGVDEKCIFRTTLQSEMQLNRWAQPIAYTRYFAISEQRRWQADVTVLPIPDPC